MQAATTVPAAPGLYVGTLRHRRFAPIPHAFTYPIVMALLDVDGIEPAMKVSRWTSYNRWNWASFDERDHPGDPRLPLRERLRLSADAAGAAFPDGPVYLLTQLRYLGYSFNPISLFYCHDRHGRLGLVAADVRNTYGGSRRYWLQPLGDATRRFRARALKALYVSPFLPLEVEYAFVMTPPGQTLGVHIEVAPSGLRDDAAERLFDATLTMTRQPWTASSLRKSLIRFPSMALSTTAAIHWQALRLRLKGLDVHPLPPTGS